MSLKPVKIGLIGLGTVGTGTVNVLQRNATEIQRRAGREIKIQRIALRDLKKKRFCDVRNIKLTNDPLAVINDPEIDIVLELVGGEDMPKQWLLQAIANKKHIITANKALLAAHGNEIFAAAHQQGVMVAFEAAVAGGIPIIKTIREGLSGNRIGWLAAILNGTTNYILSAMHQRGCEMADALKEAQRLGYAELDPSLDIDGIDVAHKLTILASIAFGIPWQFDRVYIEGIRHITQQDFSYAHQLGYCIKHLGVARRHEQGIELRATPCLIFEEHLLSHVEGANNAILLEGDAVGPLLYWGAGAGAEPTASAVVADLVELVRTLTAQVENRVPSLAVRPDSLIDLPLLPIEQTQAAYYLRMQAADKAGVLAEITKILGSLSISIESLLQKEKIRHSENQHENSFVPIIIVTHTVLEKNMRDAIAQIEALSDVNGRVMCIRLETLDGKINV